MFHDKWVNSLRLSVSEIIITGSNNGLLPGQHQVIIWTNAEVLLIGPLGINISEILIEIYTISFKKMHLKMSSAQCCLFHFGLNDLTWRLQGAVLITKTVLPGMAIPMLKIRRPDGRLIFNMEIAIHR